MNKSYEKLHVKTMNNKLLNLQLKKDTLYSNTTCASFGVNFKGYKDIDIYLNVEYKDGCNSTKEIINDSINLAYSN
jgi:hypothetical protein